MRSFVVYERKYGDTCACARMIYTPSTISYRRILRTNAIRILVWCNQVVTDTRTTYDEYVINDQYPLSHHERRYVEDGEEQKKKKNNEDEEAKQQASYIRRRRPYPMKYEIPGWSLRVYHTCYLDLLHTTYHTRMYVSSVYVYGGCRTIFVCCRINSIHEHIRIPAAVWWDHWCIRRYSTIYLLDYFGAYSSPHTQNSPFWIKNG